MAEYTQFAMKAVSLADLFNMVFRQERITGAVTYRIELSAPDGPSTAGGKQALQHIKLVPETPGAAVIVAGSASRAENHGEVRTFAQLAQLHAQRYHGAALPLHKQQYAELIRKVQRFLADQGLTVVVLDAAPGIPVPAEAADAGGGTSQALMVAVGVLVMLAVGGAVFFVLSSH